MAINFLDNTTVQGTLSSTSYVYGDGSKLTNVPYTYNSNGNVDSQPNTASSSKCTVILGGNNNSIAGSSDCSGIIGGVSNSISNSTNSFIIGSNVILNSNSPNNTTYVNNLSTTGNVNASNLAINNWNSTYTTFQSQSANSYFSSSKLNVAGGITATNEIATSIGSGSGQFRLVTPTESTILRDDGTNFYILGSNSSNGTWNNYRPFVYNNATGDVSFISTGANGAVYINNNTGYLNLNSNPVYSNGNQTVLSDGYGTNDTGNGANTISLNYTNGVYVGLSGSNPLYALGVPQYIVLGQNNTSAYGSGLSAVFLQSPTPTDYLAANAAYEIEYTVIVTLAATASYTVTYQLASTGGNFSGSMEYQHAFNFTSGTVNAPASMPTYKDSTIFNSVNTASLAMNGIGGNVTSNFNIKAYVQTGSSPIQLGLNINASNGSATIQGYTRRKVTRIY